MKKAGKITLLVGGCLYGLFGLLWIILCFISLFRGDPAIYSIPGYGYSSLILTIVRSLFYVALSVFPFLLLGEKEHPIIRIYVFVFSIAAFTLEVVMSSVLEVKGESSFLVRFIPLLFSLVYLVGSLLYYFGTKPAKKEEPEPAPAPEEKPVPVAPETAKKEEPAKPEAKVLALKKSKKSPKDQKWSFRKSGDTKK